MRECDDNKELVQYIYNTLHGAIPKLFLYLWFNQNKSNVEK